MRFSAESRDEARRRARSRRMALLSKPYPIDRMRHAEIRSIFVTAVVLLVVVVAIYFLPSNKTNARLQNASSLSGFRIDRLTPITVSATNAPTISCVLATHCVGSDGAKGGWISDTGPNGTIHVRPTSGWTQPLRGISCPSLETCWATTNSETTPRRAGVVTSSDGGRTWHDFTKIPSALSLSALACMTLTSCVVLGTSTSSLVGEIWTFSEGRVIASTTIGRISAEVLSCSSARHCVAGVGQDVVGHYFFEVSSNGGISWSADDLGKDWIPESLSCPSTLLCVAGGNGDVLANSARPHGLARIEWSADGGFSWTPVQFPLRQPVVGALSQIACTSVIHCTAYALRGSNAFALLTSSGAPWTTWRVFVTATNPGRVALACNDRCALAVFRGASPGAGAYLLHGWR